MDMREASAMTEASGLVIDRDGVQKFLARSQPSPRKREGRLGRFIRVRPRMRCAGLIGCAR
jgi:hypothetical protein